MLLQSAIGHRERIRSWWATRCDDAVLTLLRIDEQKLCGVAITSQTAAALRLRSSRVQRVSRISADGVVFPRGASEFRAEVLRQARELYGGRPGVGIDLPRLQHAIAISPPPAGRDRPDFSTQMCALLRPEVLEVPLSAAVTPDEVLALRHRGSAATALDELPRPLAAYAPAHGIAAIVHLLSCAGEPRSLLATALHMPLRKKEPSWLLRNSRPVLLQPYLRRLEATAIFRRQMRRLELLGLIPSEMFAYRSQMAAQHAGTASRPQPLFLIWP